MRRRSRDRCRPGHGARWLAPRRHARPVLVQTSKGTTTGSFPRGAQRFHQGPVRARVRCPWTKGNNQLGGLTYANKRLPGRHRARLTFSALAYKKQGGHDHRRYPAHEEKKGSSYRTPSGARPGGSPTGKSPRRFVPSSAFCGARGGWSGGHPSSRRPAGRGRSFTQVHSGTDGMRDKPQQLLIGPSPDADNLKSGLHLAHAADPGHASLEGPSTTGQYRAYQTTRRGGTRLFIRAGLL